MKTAITTINTGQIGMDEYKDIRITKIFEETATIKEVVDWANTTSKNAKWTMASLIISDVEE